jgi:transglutaminase-like putative cysteine protease
MGDSMKKTWSLLAALVFSLLFTHSADAEIKGDEYKVHFKANYSITNRTNNTIQAKGQTIFLNEENSPYSSILDERVNVENDKYQIFEKDSHLNRKVSYTIENIEPRKQKSFIYEALVKVNTIDFEFSPEKIETGDYPEEIKRYLQPSYKVESDNPAIIAKAQELKASLPIEQQSNPYYITKATFEFVQQNMKYTYDDRARNKGALFALTYGVGNCEDYSSLMVALLRANNIPARTVAGYRVAEKNMTTKEINLLTPSLYTKHMWVEAYFNGYGWVAFDPTVSSNKKVTVKLVDKNRKPLLINNQPVSVTALTPLPEPYMGTFAKLEQLYIKDTIESPEVKHTLQATGTPTTFNTTFTAKRTRYETFEQLEQDIQTKTVQRTDLRITGKLAYSPQPVQLQAFYTLSNGKTEPATDVRWSSSNPEVTTIDENGMVHFTGKTGNVTFTAKGDIFVTSISTTVSAQMYIKERLSYSPNPVPLTAELRYNSGYTQKVNATWTSSDETVATVSPEGIVQFTGKPGVVTIQASYGNYVAKVTVNVTVSLVINERITDITNPIQLTVSAIYPDKSKVLLQDVVWTSSNPSVATITPDGVVTFTKQKGTVTLTAQWGKYSTSYLITVR